MKEFNLNKYIKTELFKALFLYIYWYEIKKIKKVNKSIFNYSKIKSKGYITNNYIKLKKINMIKKLVKIKKIIRVIGKKRQI